jgi:hypothetical protein
MGIRGVTSLPPREAGTAFPQSLTPRLVAPFLFGPRPSLGVAERSERERGPFPES